MLHNPFVKKKKERLHEVLFGGKKVTFCRHGDCPKKRKKKPRTLLFSRPWENQIRDRSEEKAPAKEGKKRNSGKKKRRKMPFPPRGGGPGHAYHGGEPVVAGSRKKKRRETKKEEKKKRSRLPLFRKKKSPFHPRKRGKEA